MATAKDSDSPSSVKEAVSPLRRHLTELVDEPGGSGGTAECSDALIAASIRGPRLVDVTLPRASPVFADLLAASEGTFEAGDIRDIWGKRHGHAWHVIVTLVDAPAASGAGLAWRARRAVSQ